MAEVMVVVGCRNLRVVVGGRVADLERAVLVADDDDRAKMPGFIGSVGREVVEGHAGATGTPLCGPVYEGAACPLSTGGRR